MKSCDNCIHSAVCLSHAELIKKKLGIMIGIKANGCEHYNTGKEQYDEKNAR